MIKFIVYLTFGLILLWMWRYIESHVGNITVPGLDSYPDFLAMGLLLAATVLVCTGVNVSLINPFNIRLPLTSYTNSSCKKSNTARDGTFIKISAMTINSITLRVWTLTVQHELLLYLIWAVTEVATSILSAIDIDSWWCYVYIYIHSMLASFTTFQSVLERREAIHSSEHYFSIVNYPICILFILINNICVL